VEVIDRLARNNADFIVGAGAVFDIDIASRCLEAGAKFLTTPGLHLGIIDFALKHAVVMFPGALTPTEILAAWKAVADFVKVFPCSLLGGAAYIKALKSLVPDVPFIASGRVNQQTAADFIFAGAVALGMGRDLIQRTLLTSRARLDS
jgi:2-dehydro-3-deoxyphosphogluconate aldolase / (4S)-4-hydroxy-2-oxoglutarate aldolase